MTSWSWGSPLSRAQWTSCSLTWHFYQTTHTQAQWTSCSLTWHFYQTTHTHRPICMFRVKRRRRWLISKSSFSRQCIGRIRDTCSQLTWKSHSPHTHRGTFWPTLTPGQTSRHAKTSPNLKFVKHRRRLLIPMSPVHRSYSWYMQPVDTKLTHSHTLV